MTTSWNPTQFLRFEKNYETSTGVARIVTDQGKAYIKALGNKEGSHVLACEWIGTRLAHLIDIPTPDCAIMQVEADDEIPLGHGRQALPGPAFVSRALEGFSWSGSEKHLTTIENPETITDIVAFDTWIRNFDRCPPENLNRTPNYDNVFLAKSHSDTDAIKIVALDHTHCFTETGELKSDIQNIDKVKDKYTYGLFPEFSKFRDLERFKKTTQKISTLENEEIHSVIDSVPPEWEVNDEIRAALLNYLTQRAEFLLETLPKRGPDLDYSGHLPGL